MARGIADKQFLIQVKADIQDAVKKMRSMEQTMQRQEGVAKKLGSTYKLLGPAVGALFTAQSIGNVVRTTLAFDKLEQKLRFATGSSQAAAQEMAFVRAEAQRLGVDLLSTGDAYASVAAAARGTVLEGQATREIFSSIAEASRVLGLSVDDTNGILRAVNQIISKGVVSSEELRQQIGERLPGAFQIAARAMGVTTEELNEMLQRGEVMAEDLLPRLARELRSSVANDLPDAVNGASSSFARLNTALDELANSIGDSGLIDLLAAVADGITKLIRVAAGLDQIKLFQDSSGERARILHDRIRTINEELEKMERIAEGDGSFFERYFEYTPAQAEERIRALRAELEKIRLNLREQLFVDDIPTPTAPTSTDPTSPPRRTGRAQSAKPRRDPNEESVRALEFEAATYGQTAKEIALYRLELQGATADQKARAAAAIDAVEAEEAFAEALRQIEEAEQAAADAAERQNESLDRQAEYWRDLVNPANEYTRQLAEIEQLYETGRISAETYAEAMFKVMGAFDEFGRATEEATDQASQFAVEAARNIQDQLGDTLYNVMQGDFDNIEDGFKRVIDRMVAEALAAKLGEALFGDFGNTGSVGGVLGSFFQSFGVFHSGGMVGGQAPSSRRISPLVFAGAQRYHGGGFPGMDIRPNERAVIAEVGEEILSKNDPRNARNGGMGSVRVSATINFPDVKDYASFQRHEDFIARETARKIQSALDRV